MSYLTALWLPVLVSAVAVFLLSFVFHMLLPFHKNDYRAVPNDSAVMDALRPFAIAPGDYMVPRPNGMADMKTPEFQEKMNRGPVVMLTVFPNGMGSMGRPLAMWFVFILVVNTLSGHIAQGAFHDAVGPVDHRVIFHTVALTSFMAYGFGLWQMAIWYRRSIATTIRSTVDAAIYGIATGLVFGWLWPR